MGSLLGRFLDLWVRWTLRPEDVAARVAAAGGRVCYVLERESHADLAVLQNVCRKAGLPRPTRRLLPAQPGTREARRAWFALERPIGITQRRIDRRLPPLLPELTRASTTDPTLDIVLVPVAVYWGRAPQKERSWLRLLLADDRVVPGRCRRVLTVLFNGRSTLVQFAEPVRLRSLLETVAAGDAVETWQRTYARGTRRVARQLRAEFTRRRAAHVGPDLSHRRTVATAVLRTRAVRAVLHQEMREQKLTARAALMRANVLVEEIASNYSHAFVSFMSIALRRLWTRIYDGIELAHAATLERAAVGNEIVYVPCHRSHMDYILLSYAIYEQGYAIPHIAAGINLNLPMVGRFLRKGGAFFIRRSFRGNALYAVVFMQYMAAIMARGHPIEYFIEGGRSRTGRLLAPKTGMLSMTVRSYLRDPRRPLVFMPVYFGYERVMEATSYVNELSGKKKEKETILQFLRALRRLRENFGRVHVSLGEPIELDALLDLAEPRWRDAGVDSEARGWVNATIDELAQRIMRNINAAAAVTPVSLLATILLAAPGQSLPRDVLHAQLGRYVALLRQVSAGERVTLPSMTPEKICDEGVRLRFISVNDADGVVRLHEVTAPTAAYYRNNILHLFAVPALVAACFAPSGEPLSTGDVQSLVAGRYPAAASELFLSWSIDAVPAVVLACLRALVRVQVLQCDDAESSWQANPLAAPDDTLALLAQLATLFATGGRSAAG